MKFDNILTLSICLALTCIANAADFNKYAFTLEIKNGKEVGSYGTGCLLKQGNDIYYVTAHHIFGNASEKDLKDLPQHATIVNEVDKTIRIKPDAFVPVPDARDQSKTDFLVLKVKASSQLVDYTLKIASIPPQQGETVYLSACLPGKSLATYALPILITNKEETRYTKIPYIEKYTGASGGPILNAPGELTGTYLGRRLGANQEIQSLYGTPFQSLVTIFEGIAKTTAPAGKLAPLATSRLPLPAAPVVKSPVASTPAVAAAAEQASPTPQSTPVDLKALTAIPAGWPKTVHLKTPMDFPVVVGGKSVGSVRLPAGTEAKLTAIKNGMLMLEYQGSSGWHSPEETDLMEKLQAAH